MYNNHRTYVCPFFDNTSGYDEDGMNNGYRTYGCPYFYTPNIHFEDNSRMACPPNCPQMQNCNKGPIVLKDYGPQPFVVNINEASIQNRNYRTALWTGKYLQVTLMSIDVGDDIGLELHPDVDQFLRIEQGQGMVRMGRSKNNLSFQARVQDDCAIMVPAGTWHNLINTGNRPLKLYSIYAPPHHPQGTVQKTKPSE
ncbi:MULTISPECIES: cupin domain-containing protein [Clostridium]|uniref:cupin domain-containing protein n=1 Tax=Clostridium TaxID=1485 RepID=UPI0008267131|nr:MULTISPECIES: cupin domain-containing protein [Clostridium]PJI08552.1 cupin domain-containing protein [Clostridium sp. CT7]